MLVKKRKVSVKLKKSKRFRFRKKPAAPELDLDRLKDVEINEDELVRDLCKESFYDFCKEFWEIIIAEKPVWNWHMKYICDLAQKVAENLFLGQDKMYDLCVNVPPGTSKSTILSVMFPAWVWTRMPAARFICVSFRYTLALRLSRKCRDVIKSDKYKRLFPEVQIRGDQDAKHHFANTDGGERYAAGSGGDVIGNHSHFIIVDDPIDPVNVVSEAELESVNTWIEETLSGRKVDKEVSVTILVMQRLHQNDPTSRMLSSGGVKHVQLPAVLSWQGKPTEVKPAFLTKFYVDGLLDPVRLKRKTLEALSRKPRGAYLVGGQYLQNPVPPGGNVFDVDRLQLLDYTDELAFLDPARAKKNLVAVCRFWDKAITEGGGAYTVGVKMGLTRSQRIVIMDVQRFQYDSYKRELEIKRWAKKDGRNCIVGLEQEPGPIWEEEKVLMGDGRLTRLKNVKVGDHIIDKGGKRKPIVAVHEQGLLHTLRIETLSGRVIRAAGNHPFLTPNGWANADELEVGTPLALRTAARTSPSSQPTLEECRLAGYFVGDGCCTWIPGTNTPNASVTCSDPVQGDDIIECAESLGYKAGIRGNLYYNLSGGIRDWLRERGLAGKRTETKEVPAWVMTASDECAANFVGAFFACDGSISLSKSGTSLELYNTSKKLLRGIQTLLLRFGVNAPLRRRYYDAKFQETRRMMYRLVLKKGDDSIAKFAHHIPVYGKKAAKLDTVKRSDFTQPVLPDPIVKISGGGKLPCRCVTVGKGSSFVVNDFVVHNSGGKESVQATTRRLMGFTVKTIKPTQSKTGESRADAFSVQVNAGNVLVCRGAWRKEYVDELRHFPVSTYKDQVDASSGAFSVLWVNRRTCGGLKARDVHTADEGKPRTPSLKQRLTQFRGRRTGALRVV